MRSWPPPTQALGLESQVFPSSPTSVGLLKLSVQLWEDMDCQVPKTPVPSLAGSCSNRKELFETRCDTRGIADCIR